MGFSGEDLGYLLGRNGSFGQFGMTSSFFGYFSGVFLSEFCRGLFVGKLPGSLRRYICWTYLGCLGCVGTRGMVDMVFWTWMV